VLGNKGVQFRAFGAAPEPGIFRSGLQHFAACAALEPEIRPAFDAVEYAYQAANASENE